MGIKKFLGFGDKPSPTELLVRAAVLLIVKEIRKMEARIMSTLDDVIAKVAEQSSVVASAAALIDGLQDKLAASLTKEGVDPEKIKTIVDSLEADKVKLVEAMKENTVAEIEPAPAPVEEPAPVVEEPAPAPVEEPAPVVEEAAPAEPAPAEPEAEVKLDQWGNPI
jgi:hypothetical protein